METTEKIKKESFVGPKNLLVYFKNHNDARRITFPTSINLHKAVSAAKGEIDQPMFEIWDKLERISFVTSTIEAFIHPKEELSLRRSSKMFLTFKISFDDGTTYEIPIAGENRLRIIYKQLEELVGKPTDGKNIWLVIPQEENRFAHIKYQSPIISITSSVDRT